MATILPFLAHALLALAIWPWTHLFERRATLRMLACLVGASWWIVTIQVLLGSGQLAPTPVRALTLAIVVTLFGGWFLSGWLWRRRHPRPAPDPFAGAFALATRPSRLGIGLGVFTALVYMLAAGIGLLAPSTLQDTLNYHLTAVLHAAQTHSLDRFAHPARQFFYPQAGELHALFYYLWSGATGGSLLVAGIALLPSGLVAGVAVRAAAEALGLTRCLVWLVPATMLAPIVVVQSISGYVDVAFAAFVLAALAWAIVAAAQGRYVDVALCGVASGLALGVKVSFVYFSAPIVVVLLSRTVGRALVRGGLARASARIVLALVLFGIGGGLWLGRNWVDTGNPLFPNRVTIGSTVLFDGPTEIVFNTEMRGWFVPETSRWWRYPFHETFQGVPAYNTETGFGPLFAAGVVAMFVGLVAAFRRRQWLVVKVLLATPLTVLAFLTVNPFHTPRYVVAVQGFALLALAYVLEVVGALTPERTWLTRLERAVIVATIGLAGLAGLAATRPQLPTVLAKWRHEAWSPRDHYTLVFGEIGAAFHWLDEHAAAGTVVSFVNDRFVSPLFGSRALNRVVYMSVDGDEGSTVGQRAATYRQWRAFLALERVTWIVVWKSEFVTNQRAEQWIAEHPRDFELVEDFGGRAQIYHPRLEGDALPTAPHVADLGYPSSWSLAAREAARVEIAAAPAGVQFAFALEGATNSWVDVRAPVELDATSRRTLTFTIEARAALPTVLFVYLKHQDPSEACRFRIDVPALGPGPHPISLDLAAPDWKSPGFSLAQVAYLHLVIDDRNDADAGPGTLRVSAFR